MEVFSIRLRFALIGFTLILISFFLYISHNELMQKAEIAQHTALDPLHEMMNGALVAAHNGTSFEYDLNVEEYGKNLGNSFFKVLKSAEQITWQFLAGISCLFSGIWFIFSGKDEDGETFFSDVINFFKQSL